MIEQLSDNIAKYDVPGSQGKHCEDNNNCTDGKKDYWEEKAKAWPRPGQKSCVTMIKLYLG